MFHFLRYPSKMAAPSRPVRSFRPRVDHLEDRCTPSAFKAVALVSDQPGAVIRDPNLVNAWGLAPSPLDFWVSSNGKDVSTVYGGDGHGQTIHNTGLVVNLPGGEPTGQVFNPTNDFKVNVNGTTMPALFITSSESGHITGWAPGSGPGVATTAQGAAVVPNAVYKGIALVHNAHGNFLLAADFHNNRIDVFDKNFHRTHLTGRFIDSHIPHGFAPFNVAAIKGKVYVSYAKQDADRHDDAKGAGNGFVDVFNTNGVLISRLIQHGPLNSPWALDVAPASLGKFAGDLLVGNFGDGEIHVFNWHGHMLGTLESATGQPLAIDGLWALANGNPQSRGGGGNPNTLYYTAGPGDESHGVFGKIVVTAATSSSSSSSSGTTSPPSNTMDPGWSY
jgi:uncharacterized protein (TIGR03118 family)